ncbi:N-6 DNA methylase [Xanthomarina sp.]|uniref:Eco57I restriction-modification methylase domain-containing protein n=1 Tax=Xanthomarina sp. TaxID=1931211 RepID=UPI000C51DE22|nr:N-6 DNA methylase [Xanthomarina sp.]MAL21662.1 restriction endonuclease subunit M [Xanthomarina sp.]|tara:strand:- start:279 stop:3326 length:3048 start_codon:yes stop_codon:yes gene_type:complete
MSLFQNSVLNKYLKGLESEKVNQAYERFISHFHNPTIQENIRNSKEEQYQGEFLIDLFVNVLGYTKNPTPDFNLTTELKNITGSKKTDGAILKGEKALAVIELKGTNTTDLSKVETQAFGYKNNQTGCNYVITSNFEKLRFYIDNAVDFEEFNLFQLSKERFDILWLCLSSEYLLKDIPKKIKDESLTQEENVTKKLYKEYASFRNEIFDAIQKENPEYGKLTLFKKTQKLLDRFLFIFFAEDRLLLPPNSIRSILNQWADLRDKYDEYFPLYNRFKKYFGYMNTGHKGQQHDIFAYNGGLFAPDEILDNIKINDELLYKHTLNLSNYDFESEVSVNILGHIFEHSLNDIDEIQAEIQGVATDQSKTKRKKDGVFYTPKYITKYIVDNTVGKLCEEKKTELDIQEADYEKERKGRKSTTLKNLTQKLEDYRKWLLQITICDPACGSGAFLNQALEFLIAEHQYIDELQAKLFGDAMILSEVENSILENNLFGVDINEESVEIAKLSLWLRTAQKGRKLTSLNNNIKCGNSLIEDPEVAGDKAFNWEKEFPEVFAKGGFDVIIGNPPYVDIKGLDNDLVKVLFKTYKTTENRINLYSIFIEKGYDLIRKDGFLSFINPNSILVNSSYTKIRKLLLDDMTRIVKLPDDVFADATVETIIFEFRKNYSNDKVNTIVYNKNEKISYVDDLRTKEISKANWKQNENWNFNIYVSPEQFELLQKILSDAVELETIADFTLGITPYDKYKGHSQEIIKSRAFHSKTKDGEEYKPLISGGNIERYYVSDEITEYIKYGDWLGAPRDERFFNSPRILIRQIVSGKPPRIYAGYTDKSLYYTQIGFGVIPNSDTIGVKSLLALINSNLINFYHKYSFLDLEKELFQKILIANCKKFPISNRLLKKPNLFNLIIDKMIELKEHENLLINNFILLLQSKFDITKPSKKLQNWHELVYGEFLKELKKNKIQLSLNEEAEWMQYFNEQKQKATELKAEIDKTDKEIDQMVYELYGLTDEEIAIVEEATK